MNGKILLAIILSAIVLFACVSGTTKDVEEETTTVQEETTQSTEDETITEEAKATTLYDSGDFSIIDGNETRILIDNKDKKTNAHIFISFNGEDRELESVITNMIFMKVLEVDNINMLLISGDETYIYAWDLTSPVSYQDPESQKKYGDFLKKYGNDTSVLDENTLNKILDKMSEIQLSGKEEKTIDSNKNFSIRIEAFDENKYSSDDETDDETYDVNGYKKKLQIYKLPSGTYNAQYMYKYPSTKGNFLVSNDNIVEEDGEKIYSPSETVWANYGEDTKFTIKDDEHIEIYDGGFTFTKID